MRKLPLFLLATLFVTGCDPQGQDMLSSVVSVVDDTGREDELIASIPRVKVSAGDVHDQITGPWLWMIAPTEVGQGGPSSIDIDSLAVASGGAVTEADVAAKGASEGSVVGDLVWTPGEIADTGYDNINKLVNQIGLGEGNVDDYSSYALIILESVTARFGVTMKVRGDDSVKVWLNGEVVHKNLEPKPIISVQNGFKVDLRAGDNFLLVKVSERSNSWSMFVGMSGLSTNKITGPWLWMFAPTEVDRGGPDSVDIDSLTVASGGAVTEVDVATKGAAEGDVVGNLAWALGKIADTGYDNINELVNQLGLSEGDVDDYSSYALIILESATVQPGVTMEVGSDDSIKVWLNGEVVHRNPAYRPANDFQESFTVNLKAGDNLLLVKISERGGSWSMFVGIDADVDALYKPPVFGN